MVELEQEAHKERIAELQTRVGGADTAVRSQLLPHIGCCQSHIELHRISPHQYQLFLSKQYHAMVVTHLVLVDVQLEEVQTQLNDLHCTDINALKRAYKTLQQHVQALDIESMVRVNWLSTYGNTLHTHTHVQRPHIKATCYVCMQHLTNVVSKIDPPILTPEVLAREIGVLAAIAAGAWGLLKGLACIRLPVGGIIP